MKDFNYDQFSLETLESEQARIEENMATLEHRHQLIEAAIGRKALEGVPNEPIVS